MEITVVIICDRNGEIIELVKEVELKITDELNPSYFEIHQQLKALYPLLKRSHYCLFYRISNEKFIPVYNYLTLIAALNIMTEKKFFMLKKSALENWQHLEHPVYLLQAKPSDIELIRQVVPNADISSAHIGYTIDEANNSKKVLNLLKGVPKKMSTQSESSTDKKKKKGDSKDKIKSKDSKLKKDTSKSASDTGGKKKKATGNKKGKK